MNGHVKALRHLLSEIRQASNQKKLQDSSLVNFVFLQYKRFKVTDQQLCKAQNEMSGLANTYVTYLTSIRKYKDLLQVYQGAGERSVESTANLVGFKLPHDPKSSEVTNGSYNSAEGRFKCSKNYFMVDRMTECHPLLTCSDLENVEYVKLIGYGAVKWVFLGKWNHTLIAVSVLRNSIYSEDFNEGLGILRSLQTNRFVVQLIGYCLKTNIVATEYHNLNNANGLKYELNGRTSFGLPMRFCLNFIEVMQFLHESPLGARVNCDSDSVEKILSQILVTNQLELVLCDVDALPEFIHNVSISCGKNIPQHSASLVPPELYDVANPGYHLGYSPMSDVWKVPDVCNYFFGLAKADAISFYVFDLTCKCKNYDPFKRPSTRELVIMYKEKFENLLTEPFN